MRLLTIIPNHYPNKFMSQIVTLIKTMDLSMSTCVYIRTHEAAQAVYHITNQYKRQGLDFVMTFGQDYLTAALGPDDGRFVGPLLGKPTFSEEFPGLLVIPFPDLKFCSGQPILKKSLAGYALGVKRRLVKGL